MSENDLSKTSGLRWMILIGVGLVGMAVAAVVVFQPNFGPPPAGIANDPLLVGGRTVYLTRCVSCHGESGRGDGLLAKGLNPPKPRDFVDEPWKYGETAEKALAVVTNGVPGTSMNAWKSNFTASELKAVTAYVFYLAGKPVPEELRQP